LDKLKKAIEEMTNWFTNNKGQKEFIQTADGEPRNGTLTVQIPAQPPASANVQLTAGLALTGLYSMLAEANESVMQQQDEREPVGGDFGALVEAEPRQKLLLKQFVPVSAVVDAFRDIPASQEIQGSGKDDPAPRALAGMLTLIKTFAFNASTAHTNIKEATPILWKTPLNKFFGDPALENYPVHEVWEPLVTAVLGEDLLGKQLAYPPVGDHKKQFSIKEWVLGLKPKDGSAGNDLLYELDQHWDKSFGGIGRLEGGKGHSKGHPIFEFRSFPNSWKGLTTAVEKAAEKLGHMNRPTKEDVQAT
jgi:hypothetical protein